MPASMGVNVIQSSIHMEEPRKVSYCHFFFKPYNIQFQSKWYISSFLSRKSIPHTGDNSIITILLISSKALEIYTEK